MHFTIYIELFENVTTLFSSLWCTFPGNSKDHEFQHSGCRSFKQRAQKLNVTVFVFSVFSFSLLVDMLRNLYHCEYVLSKLSKREPQYYCIFKLSTVLQITLPNSKHKNSSNMMATSFYKDETRSENAITKTFHYYLSFISRISKAHGSYEN